MENKGNIVENIKSQIKILKGIVLLVVVSLLFLIARFLYVMLSYIPVPSIVVLLSIAAGLVTIGLYLASAVSKSAIRAIDDYNDKLNILLATTKDMREIPYGDVLLENIMDSSLRITGAEAGSIMLLEDEKLKFKVARGRESGRLPGYSFPKSEGIAGWVASNGSSVRVTDIKADGRFNPGVDSIAGSNIESILCVPMRLSAGTVGVLELINKNNGAFTPDDENMISYFADQAASAIGRVKFHDDQKNYEIHLTEILTDAMDTHVHEKRGHAKRVAKHCLLMARAINMSDEEKVRLYRACMLHDIGFLKIRQKDVKSADEYKAHSRLAFDMLNPINFYSDIAPFVLYHHERYDGGGYPEGLRGESIPLESRMIAIAEAFDAMVSKDSYKYFGKSLVEAMSPVASRFRSAIKELQDNAGAQFDPELVDVFLNNIDEGLLEEM